MPLFNKECFDNRPFLQIQKTLQGPLEDKFIQKL